MNTALLILILCGCVAIYVTRSYINLRIQQEKRCNPPEVAYIEMIMAHGQRDSNIPTDLLLSKFFGMLKRLSQGKRQEYRRNVRHLLKREPLEFRYFLCRTEVVAQQVERNANDLSQGAAEISYRWIVVVPKDLAENTKNHCATEFPKCTLVDLDESDPYIKMVNQVQTQYASDHGAEVRFKATPKKTSGSERLSDVIG